MQDRSHNIQLSPVIQACLLLSMLSGVILGVVAFRYLHPAEAAAEVHISQALQQIRRHYVEDIDEATLAKGAIDGMLAQLDHYSVLLDSLQFAQLQQDAEGAFTGIGIEVDSQDGRFTVITPMDDSPAYHAGIKAGDRLTNIDGSATEGIDINQLLNLIKGKAGTTVAVTVNRAPNEQLTFEIERARLSIDSVRVRPLEQGLVYARITRFNQNTATELANALTESTQTQPVKGLILDVRNNPGVAQFGHSCCRPIFSPRRDCYYAQTARRTGSARVPCNSGRHSAEHTHRRFNQRRFRFGLRSGCRSIARS